MCLLLGRSPVWTLPVRWPVGGLFSHSPEALGPRSARGCEGDCPGPARLLVDEPVCGLLWPHPEHTQTQYRRLSREGRHGGPDRAPPKSPQKVTALREGPLQRWLRGQPLPTLTTVLDRYIFFLSFSWCFYSVSIV